MEPMGIGHAAVVGLREGSWALEVSVANQSNKPNCLKVRQCSSRTRPAVPEALRLQAELKQLRVRIPKLPEPKTLNHDTPKPEI